MSGLVSSECGAALIVASLGPAWLRVARVAAAGLHEMAGHSDTQCKTEIRRDLSYSFLQGFYSANYLLRENYGHYANTFTFIRFATRRSFRLCYPLYNH